MTNLIRILGRRLDVAEPTPPDPDDAADDDNERHGDGRQPPDELPILVAL
jgi:hypothetical protein